MISSDQINVYAKMQSACSPISRSTRLLRTTLRFCIKLTIASQRARLRPRSRLNVRKGCRVTCATVSQYILESTNKSRGTCVPCKVLKQPVFSPGNYKWSVRECRKGFVFYHHYKAVTRTTHELLLYHYLESSLDLLL
jgi:hypothetical protein